MNKNRKIFFLIVVLALISLFIDLPMEIPLKFKFSRWQIDKILKKPEIDISFGFLRISRKTEIKQGLDLAGGTHLALKADMKNISPQDQDKALEAAKNIIDKRINLYGVSEPVVQTSKAKDEYRIIVELPGIKDISEAIDLIGKTAQLNFRESESSPSGMVATETAQIYGPFIKETGLTGKHLKRSDVVFDQNDGRPQVSLEFNDQGANLFEEITKRNINKQVAIFLDEQILSAPNVNEVISGGQAVIRGEFSLEEAKKMSIQLNAGALPVPVEVIEQRTIGATLGQESVQKSLRAGIVGLFMVAFFMLGIYGRLGLLADIGLIIYGLITLALYKIIPVVLTLPGMAGFILSIGMAVDSNILIFERMKEELRSGKPLKASMELGFGRAWDSVRDANACTLITCFILFNPFSWSFLNTSGMVRGFALTLALGIIISLFTGIVVTRTLIRLFYHR